MTSSQKSGQEWCSFPGGSGCGDSSTTTPRVWEEGMVSRPRHREDARQELSPGVRACSHPKVILRETAGDYIP